MSFIFNISKINIFYKKACVCIKILKYILSFKTMWFINDFNESNTGVLSYGVIWLAILKKIIKKNKGGIQNLVQSCVFYNNYFKILF